MISTILRRLFVAFFIVFLSCLFQVSASVSSLRNTSHDAVNNQKAAKSGAIYTGCGYLMVHNLDSTTFLVHLGSTEAHHIEYPDRQLWLIDDTLIETSITDASALDNNPGTDTVPRQGQQLLEAYQAWKTLLAAKQNGWNKLIVTSIDMSLPEGFPQVPVYAWLYDVPDTMSILGQDIERVLYVTIAIKDKVFVLSAPLRQVDKLEHVLSTIINSVATLEVKAQPVDAGEIYAKLQQTGESWPTCKNHRLDVAKTKS